MKIAWNDISEAVAQGEYNIDNQCTLFQENAVGTWDNDPNAMFDFLDAEPFAGGSDYILGDFGM